MPGTRRDFLRKTTGTMAVLGGSSLASLLAQEVGQRPPTANGVTVLNPRERVPVSLIIDDSTSLVNLAHFGIPQFAEVFPDRYQQDWRRLPREIPDDFVRAFSDWCGEHGVKGKYSMVPYPACVGWLDRDLPGWSRRDLLASLRLVRERLLSNWDIHPEMISHTWAIDTRTGRPYSERTERFMENWGFSAGKSVDELADYLSYALRILRNVELPCEGITTPGGFGNQVLPQLAQATLQSCRAVFKAEIPHYFRHLFTDERSVAPRVEYASGLDGPDPQCVVSIIGCTGDWFGGWDGLEVGSADQFITADLQGGRLPEVLARGEPAILVCHWPGIYCNGQEDGFRIFKEVVGRLHQAYDHLLWMKLSEIARYWAARELTRLERRGGTIALQAPFACRDFTMRLPAGAGQRPRWEAASQEGAALREVAGPKTLTSGTYRREGEQLVVCVDLPKGSSRLMLA